MKRKICVFKLELSRQTAGADAKHLLESLFSGSAQAPNALPTTFTDRLSFRAVLDSFHANESVDGSKRVKFNHDNGGPPDQDSKYPPSTGQDRGQSSGSCLSSFSVGGGGTVHQNYHGSASAGGAASLSMANVLSLFAPPFYRDVANELDLLDKNEQYEVFVHLPRSTLSLICWVMTKFDLKIDAALWENKIQHVFTMSCRRKTI